ncbi:hypothetical protein niasHT_038269 [Heterodera trifolii]|uniref:Uncharacterized protein n=1 Tax=Heterodera trifolii TaxID=157864 RepID=A0ABD2IBG4_9BILA
MFPFCAVPHFVPLRFNYPSLRTPIKCISHHFPASLDPQQFHHAQLTAKRPPPIAPALATSGPLPANKLPSDIARSIAGRLPDSPSSSRPPRLSTDRGTDRRVEKNSFAFF